MWYECCCDNIAKIFSYAKIRFVHIEYTKFVCRETGSVAKHKYHKVKKEELATKTDFRSQHYHISLAWYDSAKPTQSIGRAFYAACERIYLMTISRKIDKTQREKWNCISVWQRVYDAHNMCNSYLSRIVFSVSSVWRLFHFFFQILISVPRLPSQFTESLTIYTIYWIKKKWSRFLHLLMNCILVFFFNAVWYL